MDATYTTQNAHVSRSPASIAVLQIEITRYFTHLLYVLRPLIL